MKDYLFTSKRIGFREWTDDDTPLMLVLNQDPEVMKFFPDTQDLEQTRAFVGRMQKSQGERGYCYFAVDLLEKEEFIGFIGLLWQELESPYTPCVDIGWRLKPAAWGKGLATEGAKRCLKFAFETLNIDEIRSVAPVANEPSIKIMNKIGMNELGRFVYPPLKENEFLRDFVFYSILKEEYE